MNFFFEHSFSNCQSFDGHKPRGGGGIKALMAWPLTKRNFFLASLRNFPVKQHSKTNNVYASKTKTKTKTKTIELYEDYISVPFHLNHFKRFNNNNTIKLINAKLFFFEISFWEVVKWLFLMAVPLRPYPFPLRAEWPSKLYQIIFSLNYPPPLTFL